MIRRGLEEIDGILDGALGWKGLIVDIRGVGPGVGSEVRKLSAGDWGGKEVGSGEGRKRSIGVTCGPGWTGG